MELAGKPAIFSTLGGRAHASRLPSGCRWITRFDGLQRTEFLSSFMELAGVPRFTSDSEERFLPDFTEGVERGLYLALLEMLDEGLLIVSDETILEVNSAACRLLERRYGDLAGRPLSELFASEQAFLAARARLFIQGQMRGSLHLAMPDGRQREMRFCAAARLRPGIHALILSPDILRDVREDASSVWPRLAAALDQALLVLDAEDRVSAANGAALRRFGLGREGLVGRSLSHHFAVSWPSAQGDTTVRLRMGADEACTARILPGPKPGWRLLLLNPARPMTGSSATTHGAVAEPASPGSRDGMDLCAELGKALGRDVLAVRFRPEWHSAPNGLPLAVTEIQWTHPRFGHLTGRDLLSGAGENVARLGDWLLRTACDEARRWVAAGIRFRLSVPVALTQLLDPKFPRQVESALKRAGLAAERLELVLESRLLDDRQGAVEGAVQTLADQGCQVAVDGFGQGNMNLLRLGQLPLTRVMIDSGMAPGGAVNARLLEGALGVAQTFGYEAVATGVDSEVRRVQIVDLGFPALQGPAIGRPLEPALFGRRHLRRT